MAVSGSVVSRDSLVTFIEQFVRDEYARTNRPVGGARLAEAIRYQFQVVNPTLEFGQNWVAALVRIAESRGALTRDRSTKHLQVAPAGASVLLAKPVGSPSKEGAPFPMHVQPDVWRAFVHIDNLSSSYFDKRRSCVLSADEYSASHSADAVRIERIPASEQQSWMSQFISQLGLQRLDAPVNDDRWWLQFPKWLAQQSPELDIEWRKFRTRQVVAKVREWARANGIPEEQVLSPSRPRVAPSPSPMADRPIPVRDDALREAMVAAISEMPLEELVRLPIPAHYLLRHLNVR